MKTISLIALLLLPINILAETFVLTNVLLPDFDSRRLNPVTLEVEDGYIKRILDPHIVTSEYELRDGKGKVVLPPMIDMHSHSMGNRSLDGSDYQYIGIRGTANAMLYAGVHGWLDLYSIESDILPYRDKVFPSQRDEAFVFAAGPCFTIPGGHCDFGDENRLISSPEEAVEQLVSLSKLSPNVVKVVYGSGRKPRIDEATLKAFLLQASKLKIKSVVHVNTWEDVRTATEYGASAITHVPFNESMPDDIPALMAKHGTVIIPTAGLIAELNYMHGLEAHQSTGSVTTLKMTHKLVDEGLLEDYPVSDKHPAHLDWVNKLVKKKAVYLMQDALLRLDAEGVPILVGSDSANLAMYQGVGFHRELFHLQRMGFSSWQLLDAATRQSYRFLGIDWQIKPGAPAHFTLHDRAVLEDVSKSVEVEDIYLHGRKVHREALLKYANPGFIQYAKLFLGFEV